MAQVFISHGERTSDVEVRVATALSSVGLNVWLDLRDVAPGDSFVRAAEMAVRKSDAVVALVTGEITRSSWMLRETNLAAVLDKLLIPVHVGGWHHRGLPFELETRAGIELDPADDASFQRLARLVLEAIEARQPGLATISTISGDLAATTAVVVEAFATAHRILRPEPDNPQLLSPGPFWICPATELTSDEVDRFAVHLAPGRLGYLVHVGELRDDATFVLDRMRIGGKPVVTIPVRALRAAQADRRVGSYLAELERDYGNSDNLFDTKNAIVYERFLFGRDKLLNTIGSALHRHEHILLTGLRKVGKTSVLNILRQHLVDRPVCHVDLQRYDRHHEDWPKSLFHLMLNAFDAWGRTEHAPWPFITPSPTTTSDLEAELERRQEHLRSSGHDETTLVVILDELERVFPAPGEQHATRQWIRASGALRALAQGARRHVSVVGADLRPSVNRVNDLGVEGTNPFFQFFQEMPVPVLERDAVDDLIISLGRSMAIEVVSDEFLDTLFDLTGGHPSLVRKLAGESYRRRKDSYELHARDLDAALDQLESNDDVGSFLRNNLWDLMTKVEQEVVLSEVFGRPLPAYIGVGERKQAEAALRGQGLISIGLFRDLVRDEKG